MDVSIKGKLRKIFQTQIGEEPVVLLPMDCDVIPQIIRCKECKHWMRAYLAISGKHGCNVMHDYTAPDDYCFKAERKEENG
jgi:hypothetical protein